MINNVIVQEQQLYVTTAHLNVRAGAGINYPIVGGYYKGTVIEVLNIKNNWAYLKNGSYVSARYIKKYTDDEYWKATTIANMNMRKGPGTQYISTGILKKGTTVEILKEQNNWFQVKYKNRVFWLSGMYLK